MLDKVQAARVVWTVLDQAAVSLGVFLVNVQLARLLPAADYGTFALLYGVFLGLHIITASLLIYPMTIMRPGLAGETERTRLFWATASLVGLFCVPIAATLALGLWTLGRGDLVGPSLAAFLAWQAQEVVRRTLLSEFRHRSASVGDAVSYIGQVAIVWLLARRGQLAVSAVLWGMAATYVVGTLIQLRQIGLRPLAPTGLARTLREMLVMGRAALASNLMVLVRIQVFPWALAATSGVAGAAAFQAAINVANLANPLLIGLFNVIPQAAAQAQITGGNAGAWLATRTYLLIVAVPVFGYYTIVCLWPSGLLGLFYGAGSPYVALALPVQILAVAWSIGFLVDVFCAFLHGINSARQAFTINASAALLTLLLAFPMTLAWGLAGACAALLAANALRLAVAHSIKRGIIRDERDS